MVYIELADEVWDLYKRSCALLGIKTHRGLVKMLETYIFESSADVLHDGEQCLISDEPEALVRRAIGLEKLSFRKEPGAEECLYEAADGRVLRGED